MCGCRILLFRRTTLQRKKLLVVVTGLIVFLTSALSNDFVTLVGAKLGNPVLYVLSSISGSFLLLQMSKRVEYGLSEHYISKMTFLGRNTLIILGTQMLLIEVIRLLDYELFGNILYKLGILEGIVFGSIAIIGELVLIPIVNNHFSFILGRRAYTV